MRKLGWFFGDFVDFLGFLGIFGDFAFGGWVCLGFPVRGFCFGFVVELSGLDCRVLLVCALVCFVA